jgi:hypothetical protein
MLTLNYKVQGGGRGVFSSGMKFIRSFVENGQVVQELKSEIKHMAVLFFTFKYHDVAMLRLDDENNHPHHSIGIHDVRFHNKVFKAVCV